MVYEQILTDGSIIVGTGSRNRDPKAHAEPVIAGYADDMRTDKGGSTIYIRTTVKGNAQKTINSAINRYLFLHKQPTFFSSKFLLLVTYSNIAKYVNSNVRFTFQIAIASDGVHSFALLNYARLDQYAAYGVGYNNRNCGGYQELVNKHKTNTLVSTSNIGVQGMHVVPMDC